MMSGTFSDELNTVCLKVFMPFGKELSSSCRIHEKAAPGSFGDDRESGAKAVNSEGRIPVEQREYSERSKHNHLGSV